MDLDDLATTFTVSDAAVAGIPRHVVYAWRDAEQVYAISRGVYRKADAAETAYLDVLAVSRRIPRGIVCLVSALALHGLTDEVPPAVQLAVPRGTNMPRISYPQADISRLDPETFGIGRQEFEIAPGETVPVYSQERAVAEAMRMRHRVGDTVAIRALRAYLSDRHAKTAHLMEIAQQLGNASALRNAIHVMVS